MYACIILHNMILKNKNKVICFVSNYISDAPNPQLTEAEHFVIVLAIRNRETHHNLRSDLDQDQELKESVLETTDPDHRSEELLKTLRS
ncbi:hypothetical protein OSB04_002987 [Centaurea solstitialis]|uniref:Uncharacterized protein n=1 Tax=Centaurea solstitialis TaxID=347529 RepID=A0AA38WVI8_9ASTR|nr:hypothetical protein OSB04_002987 [Centaurea solstitialis]